LYIYLDSHSRLPTIQASIDDPSQVPDTRSRGSSNTLASNEPTQKPRSISNSLHTINNSTYSKNSKQPKPEVYGSVGNFDVTDSDDDIDGTVEKAKKVSTQREKDLFFQKK
jgi:hypothetical protein